ncbi:MAG: hypothetical protein KDD89_06330, partial [Anaerolineales bacterium]|nr:hypothetical protein [Anaerolineales bacterium]
IYDLVQPPHGRVQPGQLPARPGETDQPTANLAHTQTLIPWQPQTDLRTGLQTLLEHKKRR